MITPERLIINAMQSRFENAGYNVQFSRVIDPDKVQNEQLPVLSMQLGSAGIAPDLHRPKLRSVMSVDLLLWVELADNDQPLLEMIDHLGVLKRVAFQPGDDGIDSIIGRDGYVTISSGTIDIEMQQTGYGLATMTMSITYIG